MEDTSQLLALLLLAPFVVLLIVIMTSSNKIDVMPVQEEKACPPHKWDYIKGRGHVCSVCKFVSGTYESSGGNYDLK